MSQVLMEWIDAVVWNGRTDQVDEGSEDGDTTMTNFMKGGQGEELRREDQLRRVEMPYFKDNSYVWTLAVHTIVLFSCNRIWEEERAILPYFQLLLSCNRIRHGHSQKFYIASSQSLYKVLRGLLQRESVNPDKNPR